MSFQARQAYERIETITQRERSRVQLIRDDSAAGDVEADDARSLMNDITAFQTEFNSLATTPGLEDYAQAHEGNADVWATRSAAVDAACTALINWIGAALQTANNTAGTAWVTQGTALDGTQVPVTYNSTQTAGFRTECDAFLAAIA